MDMVWHSAGPVALTFRVPGDRRQVSVQSWKQFLRKTRRTVFGAEDDVQSNEAEGLGHGSEVSLVFAGCPIWIGPLALGVARFFLGRCPRLVWMGPAARYLCEPVPGEGKMPSPGIIGWKPMLHSMFIRPQGASRLVPTRDEERA